MRADDCARRAFGARPWYAETHRALDLRRGLTAHDRGSFLRTLAEIRTLPEASR